MNTRKPDPTQWSILKIYVWTLSIGLLYALWIRLTGIGIPCMFYSSTGLLCPGCGISRMFLAMLRLDLAAALQYNAAAFCLFFFWNLIALLCFWGKPSFIRKPKFLYSCLWATVVILVVFGVVRNFCVGL